MRGELLEARRVHSIVGAFFEVYNYFGFGLSESIYSRSLELELIDRGHRVSREVAVEIHYKGRRAGRQRLDMLVDEAVIVENKATASLSSDARPRLLSYLKATPLQVGLLLHFGPEPKFYRLVDSGPKSFAAIRAFSRHSRPNHIAIVTGDSPSGRGRDAESDASESSPTRPVDLQPLTFENANDAHVAKTRE